MQRKIVAFYLILVAVIAFFFLLWGNEIKTNKDKTLRIKAELLYDPIRYENPDKYLVRFSDIELISGGNYEDIELLSAEGRILTSIQKNERIKKGIEVTITLKKNYRVSEQYPFEISSEYIKEVKFEK